MPHAAKTGCECINSLLPACAAAAAVVASPNVNKWQVRVCNAAVCHKCELISVHVADRLALLAVPVAQSRSFACAYADAARSS